MTSPEADGSPLLNQDYRTTRSLHRTETKMSRTAEVKKRLGPIMERMKSSLSQIQHLEDSLQLSNGNSSEPKQEETQHGNGYRFHKGQCEASTSGTPMPGNQNSRKLMKSSMDMLKMKLHRLQQMEATLNASEGRRQNLQHLFLQGSLSKPMLELASTKSKNQKLERQVTKLEKDRDTLEDKYGGVEEMQVKIRFLNERFRELGGVEDKLEKAIAENEAYQLDLQQRQTKLSEQTTRCDDLECQVDQMTTLCDDLIKNLKNEEQRANLLELALLREKPRKVGSIELRHCPPGTIKGEGGDSTSTARTEMEFDSSTMTSSLTDESILNESADSDSGACHDHDLDRDHTMGFSFSHAEDANTSGISLFDRDECSAILSDDPGGAMIQQLMLKLEKLEKDNSELRRSKNEAQHDFHGLLKENTQQTARIHALERHVHQLAPLTPQSLEKLNLPDRKGRGGLFFKKFLKGDTTSPKRNTEKSRRISEGLAAHSLSKH